MFNGLCFGVLAVMLLALAGGMLLSVWLYLRFIRQYYRRRREERDWEVQQKMDEIMEVIYNVLSDD